MGLEVFSKLNGSMILWLLQDGRRAVSCWRAQAIPAHLLQLWLIPHVCTGQEQLHKNLQGLLKGKAGRILPNIKTGQGKLPIVCVLCWFYTAVHFQPSIRSLHSWCHTPLFSPPLDWGGISLLASWGGGSQLPVASGNLSTMSTCYRECSLSTSVLHCSSPLMDGQAHIKTSSGRSGYLPGVISSHLTGM